MTHHNSTESSVGFVGLDYIFMYISLLWGFGRIAPIPACPVKYIQSYGSRGHSICSLSEFVHQPSWIPGITLTSPLMFVASSITHLPSGLFPQDLTEVLLQCVP